MEMCLNVCVKTRLSGQSHMGTHPDTTKRPKDPKQRHERLFCSIQPHILKARTYPRGSDAMNTWQLTLHVRALVSVIHGVIIDSVRGDVIP